MTTRRSSPTTRRRSANRRSTRRRVEFRSPVVRHRRKRPKRKTVIAVGGVASLLSAIAALIGAIFSLTALVIMIVVTIVMAVVTLVMAILSDGDTAPSAVARPAPKAARKPVAAAAATTLPPGAVRCNAPTKDGGHCMRPAQPGKNCGITGHPATPPAKTP